MKLIFGALCALGLGFSANAAEIIDVEFLQDSRITKFEETLPFTLTNYFSFWKERSQRVNEALTNYKKINIYPEILSDYLKYLNNQKPFDKTVVEETVVLERPQEILVKHRVYDQGASWEDFWKTQIFPSEQNAFNLLDYKNKLKDIFNARLQEEIEKTEQKLKDLQ